jgi:hypothetical protein
MSETPPPSPINLVKVSTRAEHARHIISGFSLATPALADLWRQVADALSDVPALTAEVGSLRTWLTACRIDRANLAAAARLTIAAYHNGDLDPLAWLRDELHAQGFGVAWEDA